MRRPLIAFKYRQRTYDVRVTCSACTWMSGRTVRAERKQRETYNKKKKRNPDREYTEFLRFSHGRKPNDGDGERARDAIDDDSTILSSGRDLSNRTEYPPRPGWNRVIFRLPLKIPVVYTPIMRSSTEDGIDAPGINGTSLTEQRAHLCGGRLEK